MCIIYILHLEEIRDETNSHPPTSFSLFHHASILSPLPPCSWDTPITDDEEDGGDLFDHMLKPARDPLPPQAEWLNIIQQAAVQR